VTPAETIRACREHLKSEIALAVAPMLDAFARDVGVAITSVQIKATTVTFEDGKVAIASLSCSVDHETI
jgi:hypothetical protein